MPTIARRLIRSPQIRNETSATKTGFVVTSAVDEATDVYDRDDIQLAKWTARKVPLSSASPISRRLMLRISPPARPQAIGVRISAANAIRPAAMVSGCAPASWASVIMIAAVEAMLTPPSRIRYGKNE